MYAVGLDEGLAMPWENVERRLRRSEERRSEETQKEESRVIRTWLRLHNIAATYLDLSHNGTPPPFFAHSANSLRFVLISR